MTKALFLLVSMHVSLAYAVHFSIHEFAKREIILAEDIELESFLWNMSGICHIWTSI